MKKVMFAAIAVIALVACIALARWADHNARVPAPTHPHTSNATTPFTTSPIPSGITPTPSDIENGLGWG